VRRAAVVAVLCAALAVLAAPAAADDDAIVAAYDHAYPALKRAGKAYLRALRAAQRTDYGRRPLRRIIKADARINRLLARITRNVGRQKASSETGARAQRCIARSNHWWRRANLLEMRAARAGIHHRWKRFDRLYARSDRVFGHARKYLKCRRRALKELRGG
jgi:hypothetical protein